MGVMSDGLPDDCSPGDSPGYAVPSPGDRSPIETGTAFSYRFFCVSHAETRNHEKLGWCRHHPGRSSDRKSAAAFPFSLRPATKVVTEARWKRVQIVIRDDDLYVRFPHLASEQNHRLCESAGGVAFRVPPHRKPRHRSGQTKQPLRQTLRVHTLGFVIFACRPLARRRCLP